MLHILLLDNYDSFTFNLEHYLVSLGVHVDVKRNDVKELDALNYDGVVLSPGPGLPVAAGRMMSLIECLDGKVPVLGVCLGMQGMAEYLGGTIYNQNRVKHGVQEEIVTESSPIFKGLKNHIQVGLYHSWAVNSECGDFEIVAKSSTDIVMALQNEERKMYGVQFHPESIMTPDGMQILDNFLGIVRSAPKCN